MEEIIENQESTTIPMVIYGLYAVSFFVGITALIGVIMAYVKRGESEGFLRSHYDWQIKTFWVVLAGSILGILTVFLFIGYAILGAVFVYFLYRIIKGFMRLSEHREVA